MYGVPAAWFDKVIVEKGTEVYNAMLTDVNLAKGLNRYYVLQALEVAGRFQFFRHEGKVGQEVEESVTWAPWSYHSWDSMDRENYKVYPQSSQREAVARDEEAEVPRALYGRLAAPDDISPITTQVPFHLGEVPFRLGVVGRLDDARALREEELDAALFRAVDEGLVGRVLPVQQGVLR